MIYGAIDKKSGKYYYTDIKNVFAAIGNRQKDYNWLITGCECYPTGPETNPETCAMLRQKYCWFDGEALTDMVEKERLQWVWAVLSGFEKTVEPAEVLKYDLPYADGYEGFWKTPLTLQHPLAKVEIVPWDSSLTLILSEEEEIVKDFRRNCPWSEDLAEYLAGF